MINKHSPFKSENNSRKPYNSKNHIINFVNIIYDDEFVSLINNLSSSLKEYLKFLKNILNNIHEVISNLSNQTLYSKCLINECLSYNKNNTEKMLQLSDRIDIIENNKKLLDNNISLIEVNMSSFLDKAKILFKKMKITRKSKLNNSIRKHKNKRNNNSYTNNNISNKNKIEVKVNNKFHSSNKDIGYKRPYLNRNTFQKFFYLSSQKNKTSKSCSNLKNKILENDEIYNNDYSINNYTKRNDLINENQKTLGFNLRQFLFKSHKNKLENFLDKNNNSHNHKNSWSKFRNSNNSLFNYCAKTNSEIKNNRNKNNIENLKLKNITSSNNNEKINFNNPYNNNRNLYNNNFNINILDKNNISNKKIELMPNYFNNSNSYLNKENSFYFDNNNKSDITLTLANKIIEYFMFTKTNNEQNNIEKKKEEFN